MINNNCLTHFVFVGKTYGFNLALHSKHKDKDNKTFIFCFDRIMGPNWKEKNTFVTLYPEVNVDIEHNITFYPKNDLDLIRYEIKKSEEKKDTVDSGMINKSEVNTFFDCSVCSKHMLLYSDIEEILTFYKLNKMDAVKGYLEFRGLMEKKIE